jgi:hypothetical protein
MALHLLLNSFLYTIISEHCLMLESCLGANPQKASHASVQQGYGEGIGLASTESHLHLTDLGKLDFQPPLLT